MLTRLLAAAFLLCAASASRADNTYTASNIDELTNALSLISRDTSSTPVVLTIAKNTYDLSTIEKMHPSAWLCVSNQTWAKKLTIQGDPSVSRDEVVIDACGVRRALFLYSWSGSTTTLKNLTIKNGYTSGNYAGVQTDNWGSFYFENCVFEGNRCGGGHGAAAGGTSNKYFANCLFRLNTCGGASGSGGVVDSPNSIANCTFIDNGVYGDQIDGAVLKATCLVTNCVFDSNINTGRWGKSSALYLSGNGSAIDCVFTNNTFGTSPSTTHGGAIDLVGTGSVIKCKFYYNKAGGNGGAISWHGSAVEDFGKISDCTFIGNLASGTTSGGAISSFPGLITNCTFIANQGNQGGAVYFCTNVRDCVFAANYSHRQQGDNNGGAGYGSTFYDCVVTNNIGWYQSGAFSSCKAYRCKVGANRVSGSQHQRTVEADNSYFEGCELFEVRNYGVGWMNCGFNRCVFRDNVFTNGYGYFIGGNTAVTNCLFIRNKMYRVLSGCPKDCDNAFLNCTLVSNKYDLIAMPNSSSTVRFVNNLFFGNGTRSWSTDDDIGQSFDNLVFTNNYISTTQSYSGSGNINARSASAPKPRFMLSRDPEHPYALSRKSELNGAGCLEDWMSDAIDLAGNERLTDGKVAIGAYETTDRGPFPGYLILVK